MGVCVILCMFCIAVNKGSSVALQLKQPCKFYCYEESRELLMASLLLLGIVVLDWFSQSQHLLD